jgi:hypothetical protein
LFRLSFPIGHIEVTDEVSSLRLLSHSVSGRENRFRDGVRARDGRCVITGLVNTLAPFGSWDVFEAAHVFPLQHESIWIHQGYGRWVTNMPNEIAASRINSTQNGLLLKRDIHPLFDSYKVSINPNVSELESSSSLRKQALCCGTNTNIGRV